MVLKTEKDQEVSIKAMLPGETEIHSKANQRSGKWPPRK